MADVTLTDVVEKSLALLIVHFGTVLLGLGRHFSWCKITVDCNNGQVNSTKVKGSLRKHAYSNILKSNKKYTVSSFECRLVLYFFR